MKSLMNEHEGKDKSASLSLRASVLREHKTDVERDKTRPDASLARNLAIRSLSQMIAYKTRCCHKRKASWT
ncbi:hypothetical protein BCR43DRAFT_491063 [Syncephalastrum racemosum]|uniref:Uncharacterized protein n=1 Tax=Syncephalastrum racemosum TaxID=13706 RepID=A0A1X2HGX7_SYNRA|nr:hypothetical protein BCR43DRAFT_491061 [Syncephalastrum racemosum]ORY98227.1 hypothetical protein BCR43DRAFT_491063 [Syncephalastrum racemosum]